MTTDQMDTSMEYLSFEFQSTHVSFEERQWLSRQRKIYELDKLVQLIGNFHQTIRECQQFSLIPQSLSSSTMLPKVTLSDEHLLYYPSVINGCTDNQIDQFRLHHQQMFQLIFNDLCTDMNYRLFLIIMEGLIFYSSQTVKEYTKLLTYEMRKCLSSFDTYIRSRSTKIIDLLSFLPKSSLPRYTSVHTNDQNNIGILFQPLPKIHYLNPATDYTSIVTIDEYANHTISPEELRFIDYTMLMKNQRHTSPVCQTIANTVPVPLFPVIKPALKPNGSNSPFPFPFQVQHSLPIVYPYDDNMVYNQKYPLFWTGNNHTNENSDALFQNITVEKNSPEFFFVQRLFNKTVAETEVKIAFIERIQNSHLWEKFSSHRSYMRRKNGVENLNEQWLFHGTDSNNHHQIMSHGFNRSYCRDYVYYGRGVYFSRYACYSCHYSDRQDLSFLFLCRVLVGHHTIGSNDIRVPPTINSPTGKSLQADSTTDQKSPYSMVCTFHDDQNYPVYIITYMNKSNER